MGDLVVQLFFANCITRNPLDHRLMQRLSGTAMNFLVVAAISTINVEVVLGSSCGASTDRLETARRRAGRRLAAVGPGSQPATPSVMVARR